MPTSSHLTTELSEEFAALPPPSLARLGEVLAKLQSQEWSLDRARSYIATDAEMAPLLPDLVRLISPGDRFDAGGSQGAINRPSGPVQQYFGPHYEIKIEIPHGTDAEHITIPLDLLTQVLQPATIGPATIPEHLIKGLQGLLEQADCPGDLLQRAYLASLPAGWFDHCEKVKDITSILQQLAHAGIQSDGTLPIVTFVVRLIDALPQDRGRELRTWAGACAQLYRVGLPKATTASPQGAPAPPYLLVDIRPEKTAPYNDVFVQVCLLSSWSENTGYLYSDSEPRPLKTVPALLNDLLIQIIEGNPTSELTKLSIEVFLPLDLIGHAIETWEISRGPEQVQIGTLYPVVVRSRERTYVKQWKTTWPFWIAKWERLRQAMPSATEVVAFWPEIGQDDPARLVKQQQVIGLVITEVLPEHLGMSEVFKKTLGVGMPIALWLRHPIGALPIDARQKLQDFLKTSHASDLPRLIQEMREQAADAKDLTHIGHCLALLWDDPGRLPPDVRAASRA